MLVGKFKDHAFEYKNFEIWDISSFQEFLDGNAIIREIAAKEYKIVGDKRDELIKQPVVKSIAMMEDILDLINDKYFLVFEKNDEVHTELKMMQVMKTMDFGIDIREIDETHVYVMIMDRVSGNTHF